MAEHDLNQGWHPSRFGPDDEIGAANLITPAISLEAAKLVRTGRSYPLGVPIDTHLPAFRHRSFHLYNVQPRRSGRHRQGPQQVHLQRRARQRLDRSGHAAQRHRPHRH